MMPQAVNRRRHPRVALAGAMRARLLAMREGRVQDLSAGGMRLEHQGLLRPRAACLLRVQRPAQVCTFGGRVVGSEALGRTGAGRRRFQSGIAVTKLPAAAAPLLAHLLEQASLG